MPRKRGEGTSCHHCKKRTALKNMIKCVNDGSYKVTIGKKRKSRPCVKKYCLHCINTFYDPHYIQDHKNNNFVCPACQDGCRCAACRRRTMKAKLHADGTKLRAVQPNAIVNPILESKAGPDASKIEEEQVNSLLEILESRPDVQDIIRKGMSLDFADENAKILYIAHLIDQALSRPDILALYYAHTTGKSTLKSTKQEPDMDEDYMEMDNNNNNNNNQDIKLNLNNNENNDNNNNNNSYMMPMPYPPVLPPTLPNIPDPTLSGPNQTTNIMPILTNDQNNNNNNNNNQNQNQDIEMKLEQIKS